MNPICGRFSRQSKSSVLNLFSVMPAKLPRRLAAFHFRQSRSVLVVTAVCALLLWLATYEATFRNKPRVPVLRSAMATVGQESSARLAIFIQGYERTIPLLPSLLEAVWHPENIYAIHIDKRTPPQMMKSVYRLLENANYSSNVHLMPRQYVTYLGITTVLNTLNAISFFCDLDDSWDYFINLSGADYPLVTADLMRDVLGHPEIMDKNLSFVQTTNLSNPATGSVYSSRFYRTFIDSATYSIIRPHDPYGEEAEADPCIRGCLTTADKVAHPLFEAKSPVGIMKSEAWVILHRAAAEYALRSDLSRQLIAFFANVHCPEEFFFSTLLSHSERFRDSFVHDAFRLVLWGLFDRGSRPPAIDSGDIPDIEDLIRNKGGMFVRKRMKVDSDVRSYIDNHLRGTSESAKTSEEMQNSSQQFSRKQRMRVVCASRHRVGHNLSADSYSVYMQCLKDLLQEDS